MIEFFLGFIVCAAGVLLALAFDIGLSWLNYYWNKFSPPRRKVTDVRG